MEEENKEEQKINPKPAGDLNNKETTASAKGFSEPKEEKESLQDLLHNEEQKLPSLRTYQGDVAEFIKEKDQSVASVVVKEKERKEERAKAEPQPKTKTQKSSSSANLVMVVLSLVLILGGIVAISYILNSFQTEQEPQVIVETKLLPYANTVTLANVSLETFAEELSKIPAENGISFIKISDTGGSIIKETLEFFNFLEIAPPASLIRTLKDEYMVGTLPVDKTSSYFLVITVGDFGTSFEAMLNWEENMDRDLSFLKTEKQIYTNVSTDVRTSTSTSTATTTETVTPPLISHNWQWRDVIVKNKDTRALQDQYGATSLAYTFLDKNTILIVQDLRAIGEISSAFASRSFTR